MNEVKVIEVNGLFSVVSMVSGVVIKEGYKCEADAQRLAVKVNTNPSIKPISALSIELPSQFSINKRFLFLSQLVSMVLTDVSPSLLISGEGGLGKSYSVMQMLEDMEDGEDYIVIKGYSTARGLYNTLYDNQDKLIIFDDCDSVLKDATSLNILKGALDSYDKRVITWNAMMSQNDEYPSSFEFTGKVIFISNLAQENINQAIKSRSLIIDLHMTTADKIERMETILPNVLPESDMEVKEDAFAFLKEHSHVCKDLNMRTLIKVCKVRNSFPDNWSELALYIISA